ncbi:MAG: hypothetical protein ABIA93_04625 [Candidatus Woesearchaeota archaeon]
MVMNRKGIELSVNFLVVLILGIVIFGAGIMLFYTVFDKAKDYDRKVTDQMEERLNSLMDQGQMVAVLDATQRAAPKQPAVYALGITNKLRTAQYFCFEVSNLGGFTITQVPEPFLLQPNGKQYSLIVVEPLDNLNSEETLLVTVYNNTDSDCTTGDTVYGKKQLIVRP